VLELDYTLEPRDFVTASARLTPMTSRGRERASTGRIILALFFASVGFLVAGVLTAEGRLGSGLVPVLVPPLSSGAAAVLGWVVSPPLWDLRLRRVIRRRYREVTSPVRFRVTVEEQGLRIVADESPQFIGWSEISEILEDPDFAMVTGSDRAVVIAKRGRAAEVAGFLDEVRAHQEKFGGVTPG